MGTHKHLNQLNLSLWVCITAQEKLDRQCTASATGRVIECIQCKTANQHYSLKLLVLSTLLQQSKFLYYVGCILEGKVTTECRQKFQETIPLLFFINNFYVLLLWYTRQPCTLCDYFTTGHWSSNVELAHLEPQCTG